MIRALYQWMPGPPAARIAMLSIMAVVILALVIWSYEVLGDFLDSGGTVGE
jgi:hypothetical protein